MKRLTIKQLRSLVESVIKEDVGRVSKLSLARTVIHAGERLQAAAQAHDDMAFESALDELKSEINF